MDVKRSLPIGDIERGFMSLYAEWHYQKKWLPVSGISVEHFDRWLFAQLGKKYPENTGGYCYQYLPEDVLVALGRIADAGADTGYVLFRAWLVTLQDRCIRG